MASLFLLIAALVLHRAGAGPWMEAEPLGAGVVTIVTLGGTIGLALIGALLGSLPWTRPRLGAHAAWSRSARRTRWIGAFACIWLSGCILGIGWLDTVRAWIGDLVLADEAVAVLPALAAMALAWWLHAAHVRQIAPIESRVGFVVSQARANLPLFLAPVAMVLASQEILERWLPERGALMDSAAVAVVVVALLLSPALVMMLLSTRALPPDRDLERRIEAILAADRIRHRGVRLWDTGGTIMNALALGVLPFCRWMLLSDALVSNLTDDEALAVAGHEAGHLRHHHAVWLVGSVIGSAGCAGVAVGTLSEWIAPLLPATAWIEWASIVLVAVIVLIFFGVVSRTCERQADAYAVKALSAGGTIEAEAVGAMRRALAVVAFSNGIPPRRPSFRHGSIASRRQRLQSLVGRPRERLAVDRHMRLMQWLVVASLVVTALSLLLPAPAAPPTPIDDHMIPVAERTR